MTRPARGALASEQTVFLAPPRFLDLPKTKTKTSRRLLTPTQALLTVRSPVSQHAFWFEFSDTSFIAANNGSVLYPNEKGGARDLRRSDDQSKNRRRAARPLAGGHLCLTPAAGNNRA